MEPTRSTTLIVGAGIFGTSTAYHLSRNSQASDSITVVDRTPFPPAHAASTDITKIIRTDYTDAFYMDLAREAMDAWCSWPELKPYFHRTGWVHCALDEADEGVADKVRGLLRERGMLGTRGIAVEELKGEFAGLFKHADLEKIKAAYWNPDPGWCNAGRATAELMSAAVKAGVKYETGDVRELRLGEAGVEGVMLADGRVLTADRVVLATGAWTSSILSPLEDQLEMADADRVESQVHAAGVAVGHFKLSAEEKRVLREMPVIIWGGNGDIQPYPDDDILKITNGSSFVNKITTASGHQISVPPERPQDVLSEKLKGESHDLIMDRVLPQYTNRPADYWRLCWDACTPTQDHLVTKHPHASLSNLYLAVGGSFHSYKFLPNAGKYVANMLNGQSNGPEKDARWAWKSSSYNRGGGSHEKAYPTRDLSTLES